MKIAHRTLEEQASNPGENGIPEIAVQWRHRARQNSALEPVSHHQVISFAQLSDERIQLREIVTVIRIAHQNESSARGCDASVQRAPVTARLDRNDSRSKRPRQFAAIHPCCHCRRRSLHRGFHAAPWRRALS